MRLAAVTAALLLAVPAAADPALPSASSMLTWTPEQQAIGYRSVERIFPHHVVKRGATVRPLPAGTPIDPTLPVAGHTWTVEQWMQAYRVSGVIVLRDGKVLLERYGLGRRPDDTWTSFSVAKSVTALLAGAAIGDGKLRLDDPVVRFVPELAGSAYDGVTVGQLLTMSSGVAWTEDYTDPDSDNSRLSRAGFGSGDALIGALKALPRAHSPGTVWHYNTAETHLAGAVIARAVGMSLADYLSAKIWRPYGMEHDAAWIIDGQGREAAGCCLSMTLRDYARVGQFVLDGGRAGGKQVVPADYLAAATSVRIANDQPPPSGYGYFWWIGPRAFEASGIFGQSILVYPREQIVIAVNSAWPRPVGADLFAALHLFDGAAHDAAAPDAPATLHR
ncbi:MAG: beta-lactamase family protein [Sphingomonadaceae bacterium]|nr:beta-lactamase family protein [Sphingomonadaceae bacterium]